MSKFQNFFVYLCIWKGKSKNCYCDISLVLLQQKTNNNDNISLPKCLHNVLIHCSSSWSRINFFLVERLTKTWLLQIARALATVSYTTAFGVIQVSTINIKYASDNARVKFIHFRCYTDSLSVCVCECVCVLPHTELGQRYVLALTLTLAIILNSMQQC